MKIKIEVLRMFNKNLYYDTIELRLKIGGKG